MLKISLPLARLFEYLVQPEKAIKIKGDHYERHENDTFKIDVKVNVFGKYC
jgi:hypothetical protein